MKDILAEPPPPSPAPTHFPMHTEELDLSSRKMPALEPLVTLLRHQPYSRVLTLHLGSKQSTTSKGLALVFLPPHPGLAGVSHNT